MERHPFTMKERVSFKRSIRAVPCVVGFVVSLFFIGRETGGLLTIVLMLASAFAFWMLYIFLTHRMTTEELLTSPCPKCGQNPMRFDRGSEGDYVFTCDKCQIEWTLDVPW